MALNCRPVIFYQRTSFRDLLIIVSLASSTFHVAESTFCMPTPGSCWPTKAALAAWISDLGDSTSVLLPDKHGEDFLAETATMNSLKSNFPGIIVVPGTENDLRSAIRFASRHRIRITVCCSGNDFNGRSTGRGAMIIKTSRLNNVVYDDASQTVTFGAGTTHGDIYRALAQYRRLFVGAQSNAVCAAGCLAGGCHSLLSRQHGLGIDSVLAIRFALYNGTILTLNRTNNADLFHTYLGAGANSFGVAVSFTVKTYLAPPYIHVIDALFAVLDPTAPNPDKLLPNLMSTFFLNASWFGSMPWELAGNINIDGGVVSVRLVYVGPRFNAALRALQPLLASSYTLKVDRITNYTDMYQYVEANTSPLDNIWARRFISNAFFPADDPWVLDTLTSMIVNYKPKMRLWFVFGGAVAEASTGAVPIGMRTAMYEAVFDQVWFDPVEDADRIQYVSRFAQDLYGFAEVSYSNEFTSWGSLYNMVSDWKTRFFLDYESLLAVKEKYDPCNLFTAKYSVGSDEPQATCVFMEALPPRPPRPPRKPATTTFALGVTVATARAATPSGVLTEEQKDTLL